MFEYLQGLSEWWALAPLGIVSLALILLERYQDKKARRSIRQRIKRTIGG